MFFAREASLRDSPNSLTASTVIPVRSSAVQLEVGQRVVLERVGVVADLGQVALGEVRGVGDDQPAAGKVVDVGLERRRVHRDQHVRTVARGHDVVVGEVQLEARDAGQGALRGADLGGEVRQGRDVVAEGRRVGGEPVAGQLHPVAGVAGEADDHPVERVDLSHCVEPSSVWTVPPPVGVGRPHAGVVRRTSGAALPGGSSAWARRRLSHDKGVLTTNYSLLRASSGPFVTQDTLPAMAARGVTSSNFRSLVHRARGQDARSSVPGGRATPNSGIWSTVRGQVARSCRGTRGRGAGAPVSLPGSCRARPGRWRTTAPAAAGTP